MASFQRQLNLYGFRRLTKGEDQGAYFHPKFQRNRKDLLSEIHRLPGKGTLSTLEQVLNNNNDIELNPTSKNSPDKPNTEISNKQSLKSASKLPVKSIIPKITITKQPKQTKQSIQTYKNQYSQNPTNNTVTTSYINSTIPTSALYLNSSQYYQQYNTYHMQNPNNFYQYIPNHSYSNPTSSINSYSTFNSSSIQNNNNNNNNNRISYSKNINNNFNKNLSSNGNNTNLKDYLSKSDFDINNNYFNLSNQDHLLLNSLIDFQPDSNRISNFNI